MKSALNGLLTLFLFAVAFNWIQGEDGYKITLSGVIDSTLGTSLESPETGPSKREIKVNSMIEQWPFIETYTNFEQQKYFMMTDIQRENWDEENKDKLFRVNRELYQVERVYEGLTESGGYNRYSVMLTVDPFEGIDRAVADDNYFASGLFCRRIYAFNNEQKTAIEALNSGSMVDVLAAQVSVGKSTHSAETCIIKGIH